MATSVHYETYKFNAEFVGISKEKVVGQCLKRSKILQHQNCRHINLVIENWSNRCAAAEGLRNVNC